MPGPQQVVNHGPVKEEDWLNRLPKPVEREVEEKTKPRFQGPF
jgi:hypothetical protein